MGLIEIEEEIENKGQRAAEDGVLHDRLPFEELFRSEKSQKRSGQGSPRDDQEQIHRLNHWHARIEKFEHGTNPADALCLIMFPPKEPKRAAGEINHRENYKRTPAPLPYEPEKKRQRKERVPNRLMQANGEDTDEGRQIEPASIGSRIEPKPDPDQRQMRRHGASRHGHEHKLL